MHEGEPNTSILEAGDQPSPIAGMGDVFVPWSPDLLADFHPSLRKLYEYWNAKRGGRAIPARGDIDPIDLKPLLPLLILIDVVPDPRRYVYRLVGTHEVEMRGGDPTGKPVEEAYYGESADEATYCLDRVVRTRQPVLYRGTYQPLSTRTQQEDVIFLPLSKNGEAVNMIVVLGHTDWVRNETRA